MDRDRSNTEGKANNQLDAVENEPDAQRGKKITEAEYLIITDRKEQADKKTEQAVKADIS